MRFGDRSPAPVVSLETPQTGPLVDQSLEDVKRVFDTNTYAILRTAKAVIPVMAKRHSGVIVNIGSIVGEL